jgi:hemolysin activation/secretion protein
MKWKRGIRAHELAFVTRGQYVLNDARLSPQLEFIAGGFNTVRGYPESFSAGDNAILGSFEYRLHIPRLFAPYEVLDAKKDLQMLLSRKPLPPVPKGKKGKKTPVPSLPPVRLASAEDRARKFNFRAPQAGGEADWDLIFRVFADGAQTYNNNLQVATEVDRTMLSVGAGIELQIFKPLYMTFRIDYGMALSDESELLLEPVRAGDSRIHISGTIAW